MDRCLVCGSDFIKTHKGGSCQKYCTSKCRKKNSNNKYYAKDGKYYSDYLKKYQSTKQYLVWRKAYRKKPSVRIRENEYLKKYLKKYKIVHGKSYESRYYGTEKYTRTHAIKSWLMYHGFPLSCVGELYGNIYLFKKEVENEAS